MRAVHRAWAAILLFHPAVAWGHPFATRITAHQLKVVLTPSTVRVDYTVETPMAPPSGPEGEVATKALDVESVDEMASGLLLQVDGQTVPLQPDPKTPSRVRQAGQTVAMRIGLVAPAPAGKVATLRLSNANYPDLPAYFRTEVVVDPQVQVLSSSLFVVDPLTGQPRDEDGTWHPGDPWRTLLVTVRYRRGALATGYRRLEGTEGTRIGAWQARPSTPWGAWLNGGMQPGWLLALTVLAGILGTTEPRAHGRGVTKALAAAALPAVLLAVAPDAVWPWFALVAALATAGLAVRRLTGGTAPYVALGAVATLAFAVRHAGFAALLAVGATIGVLVGRGRPDALPRPSPGITTAAVVLGIAVLVVIRSLGTLL